MNASTQFNVGKSLGLANDAKSIPAHIKKIEELKKLAGDEAIHERENMKKMATLAIQEFERGCTVIFDKQDQILSKSNKLIQQLQQQQQHLSSADAKVKGIAERIWDTTEKNFFTSLQGLQATIPALTQKMEEVMNAMTTHLDAFDTKLTKYVEALKSAHTDLRDLEEGYFVGNAIREALT